MTATNRLPLMVVLAGLALLALVGCDHASGVAIEIAAPSDAILAPPLGDWLPLAAAPSFAGLWRDLPLPPDRVAVLGANAGEGLWRISLPALQGQTLGRDHPPLSKLARRRLERFLDHAEVAPEITALPTASREPALALHTTRALLAECVGKYNLAVTFARLEVADPAQAAFAAAAVRDAVDLAGPDATTVLWLTSPGQVRILATGRRAEALQKDPDRASVVAALVGDKE